MFLLIAETVERRQEAEVLLLVEAPVWCEGP
jgi:hypothetical protein